MSVGILAAVLFSAVLHGTWNVIAKVIPNRLVAAALIGIPNFVLGAIGCVIFPLPAAESWPLLLISAVLQASAFILVTAAYAYTEFGRAYPMSRGIAILGITIVSVLALGESLTGWQALGVAIIAGALCALAWSAGSDLDIQGLSVVVALGLVVAAYSLLDGVGVRWSGTVLGYASWVFALQGLMLPPLCYVLAADRRELLTGMRRHAVLGTIGGTLTVVTYGIVIWAQSQAPLALVAALRETGVIAAAFIGWLMFDERLRPVAVVAAVAVVTGIALLRLGG